MLDEALAQLAGYGPDLSNGLTSHAPMVVEALCTLGRPDAVVPWLERHRSEFTERPPRRERIDPVRWRSALAREDRFPDWSAFFAEELANAPWREVLDTWVARLAPGVCANATHGVIRLAHATRAMGAAETAARRRELADALASWASTYQELPAAPRNGARALRPREAITHVALQPIAERRFAGTIVSALAGLDAFPAFADTIALVDGTGDPTALVAEMTEAFAQILLDHAHDTLTAIVFTHGVTSVAAFGNLLPHIREGTARAALPYVWQSACGLYAAFGAHGAKPTAVDPALELSADLVERAIAHGDEHAIKLTEACLAQHRRRPSPLHAAAVRRALEHLVPG